MNLDGPGHLIPSWAIPIYETYTGISRDILTCRPEAAGGKPATQKLQPEPVQKARAQGWAYGRTVTGPGDQAPGGPNRD